MTPTKLLVGQILVVFAIMALGVWAATQWAASMLAYQPELGPAWLRVLGLPLYRPWALFGWWFHFDAYAPAVFDKAGASGRNSIPAHPSRCHCTRAATVARPPSAEILSSTPGKRAICVSILHPL
jgi:hypothetical protein